MKISALFNSFRARLLLLLSVLLVLTLGVQYYVNVRSVRNNAHLIVEQEQAIMAGVALGVNSISSRKYLDELRSSLRAPLTGEENGRVQNVLVVDGEGFIQDSLIGDYGPRKNEDNSATYVRLKDVPLPPLNSAVELGDEAPGLPPWLTGRPAAKPGEPGAFYFPLETTKGRWYIIVVLGSANTLTNILERQARRSASYTLLLLLATTIVTGIFVWRFTRPINFLSSAARRVAGGDFSVRVPTDQRDEMGALAAAFNEMTAKLARARELETQLHAAEKGAVVGRLAAAIAHEIRNPLNYINLTLDHLRSTFTPEDPKKGETFARLTDQLKTEVRRINRHITDFLKYSRPSMLEPQQMDLRSEVEDALRVVQAQADESNILIRLEVEENMPSAIADREALRSVFTNLVVNGLQAIDGEGGSVRIAIRPDQSGDLAVIEVSDTGRGIAPEDIAKVFEPYYSTKETGTGLGLAIVRKAVDDHGGTISVTSKQGSGTTFTITLPLKAKANPVEG
ncbi:MAG: HAMP domain-containing protein [Pyrinomonadaceae bacterium]|nr:HAMP domain-containing protein [Pyrinomonadaceae bacterium]